MILVKLKKKLKFLKKYFLISERLISKVLRIIIPDRLKYHFFQSKVYVLKNGNRIFSLRNYSNTCKWRAETFLKKEPDTIEWINSFDPDDIFLDIGANIGIYSMYAARKKNMVWAIEPESLNYAMLNLNINDNNLSHKITALSIALHKNSIIDSLNIQSLNWGDALNSFENVEDQFGEKFKPVFKQGCYSVTLDELLSRIGKIDHIKIDVDGNEDEILAGGMNSIKEKKFKSILIELDENLNNYNESIIKLTNNGYVLHKKTVSTFHPEIFGSTKNHIFYRV